MFKKIFDGNKQKESKGGSDVYTYDAVNDTELNGAILPLFGADGRLRVSFTTSNTKPSKIYVIDN